MSWSTRQAGPRRRHEGGREGARRGAAAGPSRAAEGRQGGRRRRARRPAPRAQAPPGVAPAFRDGGRDELADGEEAEAAVIEAYLPAELSDEELRAIVAAAMAETGAPRRKDMGAVMKVAMGEVGGRADGKRVSALGREALGRAPPDRALQRGRGRAGRQAATRSCARSRATSSASSSCAATSSRSTASPTPWPTRRPSCASSPSSSSRATRSRPGRSPP